jgi:MFS family permease
VTTTHAPGKSATAPSDNLGHVIFITAAAAMGGFLFGYDSSVINGAVTAIQHRYHVGSAELAQVVAVALIGSAIGAALAGRMPTGSAASG